MVAQSVTVPPQIGKPYSYRQCATRWRISKSSLFNKVNGKPQGTRGAPRIFIDEEEDEIAQLIKQIGRTGWSLDCDQIKTAVFVMAKQLNRLWRNATLTQNKAGDKSFKNFKKRQARLSKKMSEGMSIARLFAFNEHTVGSFFDELEKIYNRLPELQASDIYNMDETGFQMTTEKRYVS